VSGGVNIPRHSNLFYNITLLDKTTEHLKQNSLLWKKRKVHYNGVNDYCNENFLYNRDNDFLKPANCKCYNCDRCRPKKKYDLLKNIVRAAERHNLRRHLIITLPGYPFRSLFCNCNESFDYCMKKFNEFRVLYKREFGRNLSYICLPRSQEDGFCHLHILVGSYIPKDWLDKTLKNINLGYPFITYVDVQRLSNYLSKYWYKEHEWYIPKNKKHYTRSADIELESFTPDSSWYFIGVPNNIYTAGSDVIDCIYRCLDWINPIHNPPPFNIMLGLFYEDLNKEYNNSYISFLRKYGIKNPVGIYNSRNPSNIRSNQLKLFYSGNSYHVFIEPFMKKKYSRQKKFRKGVFYDKKAKYT
jgi:hypothetical protein